MEKIQLSKNLWLHEYIDEKTYKDYEKRGKLHHLVWKLDSRLIQIDQYLRDKFGSVTINNWAYGGDRNWSGLRTPDSPDYSPDSQHTYGRASDKVFSDASAKTVIQYIEDHYESTFKLMGLRGLEKRATWVHSDVRFSDKLITFTP